jgi:hypothetical protein
MNYNVYSKLRRHRSGGGRFLRWLLTSPSIFLHFGLLGRVVRGIGSSLL